MAELACPECDRVQTVDVTADTYVVVCEQCSYDFKIPREHRVNKRDMQEYKSSVNVRIGYRTSGDELVVGWTVQSAEKGNQYLEREAVAVDIATHPHKTYWYVAVFKALQRMNEYKSARIWVKHNQVIDHLSGDIKLPDDDVRARLVDSITDLCDEKFLGYEFGVTDTVGGDIKRLLSSQ